jgi:GntR family transcriptional regulator/MocR family aminotransferase
MRCLYKAKHTQMLTSIATHFDDRVEVISQAAGQHVTLKWLQGIDEQSWSQRAAAQGIIIRPLSYYEQAIHPGQAPIQKRKWQGEVLGYWKY